MDYDFQTFPDRTGTGSLKWDRYGGRDVLPFWVADMDFRSAPEILESLRGRADHGVFGYTVPHEEPIEAVRNYLAERHGVAASPESIVWLPGLVPALNLAARAFGDDSRGVKTCTPVYPPFLSAPANARVPLQTAPLVRDGRRWRMDFDALAGLDDGGIFFLCNPHNPVGACFSREEIERVLSLCREKDWILCSDEIHCDLILDEGVRHVPALPLADPESDPVIALYAPSKTWNLPGLACAYAVIPHRGTRARFKREIQGIVTEVNCFGYAGCAAAYDHGEPWRRALIEVLRANRDRVYEFFADQRDRVTIHPMEATYLAWFDARCLPVEKPADFFEGHGVGLSDGEPFGAPGWLRLNFGCPPQHLEKGLARLQAAFDSLG